MKTLTLQRGERFYRTRTLDTPADREVALWENANGFARSAAQHPALLPIILNATILTGAHLERVLREHRARRETS